MEYRQTVKDAGILSLLSLFRETVVLTRAAKQ